MGIGDLYIHIAKLYWKHFNRILPLCEMLVSRDAKAAMLRFGAGSTIHDSSHVYGDVRVGEDTWVGPFTILDGSGAPLSVGNHCSISAGVHIYTHDTVEWAISGGDIDKGPSVTIGDNCYIGPNVVIVRGVTIGDRCVIGANSVVLTSIPPGTRAWGNPATIQAKTGDI